MIAGQTCPVTIQSPLGTYVACETQRLILCLSTQGKPPLRLELILSNCKKP